MFVLQDLHYPTGFPGVRGETPVTLSSYIGRTKDPNPTYDRSFPSHTPTGGLVTLVHTTSLPRGFLLTSYKRFLSFPNFRSFSSSIDDDVHVLKFSVVKWYT